MTSLVVLTSDDLTSDIARLEAGGFRLDVIFPADGPRVAELSSADMRVRLDTSAEPNGTTIEIAGIGLPGGDEVPSSLSRLDPAPQRSSAVVSGGGQWDTGRAGMQYRDLVPGRLGGAVIASHIRIAEDGPVPDRVHHHDIEFQMIYCRRGRVRLVYEDQGEPFWIEAGDCVLQPPHIRHRVLESADSLEVVEIAMPAEHPTFIDHDLELPTQDAQSDRDFDGQRFCVDQLSGFSWSESAPGWEEVTYGISQATGGLADVRALRSSTAAAELHGRHDGQVRFFYVLAGEATLDSGGESFAVGPDGSASIPANTPWALRTACDDFEMLSVQIGGEAQ